MLEFVFAPGDGFGGRNLHAEFRLRIASNNSSGRPISTVDSCALRHGGQSRLYLLLARQCLHHSRRLDPAKAAYPGQQLLPRAGRPGPLHIKLPVPPPRMHA